MNVDLDPQVRQGAVARGVGNFSAAVADATTALIFYAAAIVPLLPPPGVPSIVRRLGSVETADDLLAGAAIEAGLLMSQAMLVDIATRISFRPPWWLVALIAVLFLIGTPGAAMLVNAASSAGWVVLLPLLLSVAQRLSVLWRMPAQPPLPKIAARALIGNRCLTGFVVVVLVVALSIASTSFYEQYHNLRSPLSLVFALAATHFAIAAFDGWRAQSRRFAEQPSVLFRFDLLGIGEVE
jgi:hypothetical protein